MDSDCIEAMCPLGLVHTLPDNYCILISAHRFDIGVLGYGFVEDRDVKQSSFGIISQFILPGSVHSPAGRRQGSPRQKVPASTGVTEAATQIRASKAILIRLHPSMTGAWPACRKRLLPRESI